METFAMTTLQRAWRAGKSEWRTHLTSVLGTSVAFLCLSFALISTVNLEELEARWERPGRVSAYLVAAASEQEVRDLETALRRSEGVSMAEVISSERARNELLGHVENSLLEALPVEAFPPSIEVTLTESASRERAAEVLDMLAKMPAVESIESYQGWTDRIRGLVRAAGVVAWALAAVVFLAVVAVIASTTRLSLHKRRDEVMVLRYVGATVDYVRGPFLLEGAVQGALGAVLSLLLAAIIFGALHRSFAEQFMLLLGTAPRFLPWTHWFALPAVGALLGALAANASLRRAFSS